jgi:hypothetical protein
LTDSRHRISARPTRLQTPASSLPRRRKLHLYRHPQRRQHRQHFADLRGRLAGFKINDEPQPDIGDARELVLPQLLRLARRSDGRADFGGGDVVFEHDVTERESIMIFGGKSSGYY